MQIKDKPTYVTMPSLAPLHELSELLAGVWERGILTHNGPLVQQLEKELCEYMRIKNMVAMTNGTVAIQLAIKALDLKGEIITTPFTWVATATAIIWEQCTPIFVDVDPDTLNIDPSKIEDAITHKTVGILPVHVFSNPCDVEAIDEIAKRKNLKVIYDAAHAMCVDYKGKSVLEYGDISATSFHATKLFNTGEGGGCITTDNDLHERLKRLRFFGHNDKKEIVDEGCNGKMTEIHAALGLVNLRYQDQVREKRRQLFDTYFEQLSPIDEIKFQQFDKEAYNYSYMPVIFDSEERLLKVDQALKAKDIHARRYFYPSVNTMRGIAQYTPTPISEDIAKRILCLPSFNELSFDKALEVSQIVKQQF